jgi:heme oxygenase
MTLRDAISSKHNKAEQHRFVVALLNKTLPQPAYAEYLHNQYLCYSALEDRVKSFDMFADITELYRSELIKQDINELGYASKVHPSTTTYVKYIDTVPETKLWAHVYARHFADLYGGQLIKKVAPGSGAMYEFVDRQKLINAVRQKLALDLADEANLVFDYVIQLFTELANEHNIQ